MLKLNQIQIKTLGNSHGHTPLIPSPAFLSNCVAGGVGGDFLQRNDLLKRRGGVKKN